MPADYTFTEEISFLGFRIRWHANQQLPIDILHEQLLYSSQPVSGAVRDSFDFYINMVADDTADASWNTALQHRYDSEEKCLYLSYLNEAIRVRVNYAEKSVTATIMERALAYRAALGNWVLTIPLSELLKLHGIYLMHAACLVREGKGILFAGRSGVGKTTLTIGLLVMGWQMVADDEVFLVSNPRLLAYGGPEQAKVSWQSWKRFSYYLGEQSRFNGKKIIHLSDYFPGQVLDRHKVSAICFVEKSDRTKITAIDPLRCYQRLLSVAFLNSEPKLTRRNSDFVYEISQKIPAYRLGVGLDIKALHTTLIDTVLSGN
jgi:hypothetical protein